jgi:ribosomal protein L7/L12
MPTDHTSQSLPKEAMLAADRGDVIEAIKIARQGTGLSLKEAKDAVDAYSRGTGPGDSGGTSTQIPQNAIASLYQGKLIDAIKKTRASTGLGLKDAKEAVELYLARNPTTNQRFQAATEPGRRAVMRAVRIVVAIGLLVLGYVWLSGKQ